MPNRDSYAAKIIRDRYGNAKGCSMLEIGGCDIPIVSENIPLENNYLVELDSYAVHLNEQIEATSGKPNIDYMLACAPFGVVYDRNLGLVGHNEKSILPFRESSFDVIFLFCYPMYTQTNKNLAYLFSDLNRVLKTGGEILVSPNFKKRKGFLKEMFDVETYKNMFVLKKR